MRTYEFLVLLKPDLSEAQIRAVIDRLRGVIDAKGRVYSIDYWGKKKLAYEIKPYSKGIYVRFVMAADPTHIGEIERVARITEDVLRFLAVKLSDSADPAALEAQYGPEPVYEIRSADRGDGGEAREEHEERERAERQPAPPRTQEATGEDDEEDEDDAEESRARTLPKED